MSLFAEFVPYHHALLALCVLVIVVLVQAVLTAPLALASGEQQPGAPLKGDHTLLSFRVLRTHANSVEALGPFGFALIAAVIAGASIAVVNWAAVIHVLFRLGFWAVYYAGVGKAAGGPRTLCFIGGLFANLVLVGAAIVALLGSGS